MDQLMTELIEESASWELVGIQLLVPDWKLGSIKRENRGQCKECLMKVLEYWRKHAAWSQESIFMGNNCSITIRWKHSISRRYQTEICIHEKATRFVK